LAGDTTVAANKYLNMASGAGAFQTGRGVATVNGPVTVAANMDFKMNPSGGGKFDTGTGTITLAGDTTIINDKMFTTGTGTVSLLGDTSIAGEERTFTTGTGAVTLSGDVSVAADKDLKMDGSGSGTFKTGTGLISLNGATTIGGSKTFTVGSAGSGGTVGIYGSTFLVGSGGLSSHAADANFYGTAVFKAVGGNGNTFFMNDVTVKAPNTFSIGSSFQNIVCNGAEGGVSDICVASR